MKVKILNATLESYWYSDRIGEELTVIYNICDRDNTYRQTDKPRYIRNVDVVITELPESFCVKRCDDKDKWEKYIRWLNKTYDTTNLGKFVEYLGYHTSHNVVGSDKPLGIEIHIDDMIKHIDYMESQLTIKMDKEFDLTTLEGRLVYAKKHYPIGCTVIEVSGEKCKSKVKEIHTSVNNSIKLQFGAGLLYNNITGEWAEIIKEEKTMETQKLSRQSLKEIHSIACSSWKETLEQFGRRNPLEDYIELSQDEINIMFDACTKEQLPIVSKYLKKDDGSVDVSVCSITTFIQIRNSAEYENKAYWLDNRFNWDIKEDSVGDLCLIPTKKK